MAEITRYGFERETYEEVLETIKNMFRQDMGVEAQLGDDNPLGQIAAILAKLQNDNNRVAEAIWSSQRLDGAEGIYLDDIFSKNGVYRRGKQPGTGIVYIEMDEDAPNNTILPDTTQFTSSNGKVYQADDDFLLTTTVVAYKLSISEITDTSYSVVLLSTIDGATQNFVFTNDGTDASKRLMLDAISSMFLTYTDGNIDRVFVDTTEDTLYVGFYVVSKQLIGLSEQTEFQITPVIGHKWAAVGVTSLTDGFYPLASGGIDAMTPTFTGFVDATNVLPFYSGSEVETDAEYRNRYFSEIQAIGASTRDGVVSNVFRVGGVEKVTIYDNPTAVNRDDADALSFHVVVLGGSTAEISQAIYASKPINTQTSGSTSYTVNTLDGGTETIRHSKAVQVNVDVRIDYRTTDRVPLSNLERSAMVAGLQDFFDEIRIGEMLYNTQLVFVALNTATRNRIVAVNVYTKRSSDADSLFITADQTPDFTELFVLRPGGVSFNQLV